MEKFQLQFKENPTLSQSLLARERAVCAQTSLITSRFVGERTLPRGIVHGTRTGTRVLVRFRDTFEESAPKFNNQDDILY